MIEVDAASLSHPETVLPDALVASVAVNRAIRFKDVPVASSRSLRFVKELVETIAPTALTEEGRDLVVSPEARPGAGEYEFDLARHGGSGRPTVPEVWTPLVVLLSRGRGPSTVRLRGVTHGRASCGYGFVKSVLPALLEPLGFSFRSNLERWGFSPDGEGLVRGTIEGKGPAFDPSGLTMEEKGSLEDLRGTSAVGNLPASVLRRQTREATDQLRDAGFDPAVESVPVESRQPGTSLELTACYEHLTTSFLAVGEPDKRAESVAREAVSDFLRYHRSEAAVPAGLASRILPPVLLSSESTTFPVSRVTRPLKEMVGLLDDFLERTVLLEGGVGEIGRVTLNSTG